MHKRPTVVAMLAVVLTQLPAPELNIRFNRLIDLRGPMIAEVVSNPAIIAPVTPQVSTS